MNSRVRIRSLAGGLVMLLLTACTALPATPSAADPGTPPLLLVSIDGLHPELLGQGNSPNLDRLAAEGVQARWMNPSYPSLTFPNHYTLVTGLRPDRHGIVDNSMNDAELGGFWLSNRDAVGDGRWWDDAEPIWVSAERQGLRSATMFWPGSEAEIHGIRPSFWHPYDGAMTGAQRVAQVLEWLELPIGERPALLTLYFEKVDSVGHTTGPATAEVGAALAAIDADIGVLLEGLEDRGIALNLVVVSDHGMAATVPERVVFVEDIVPEGSASLVTVGSALSMDPRPGREQELVQAVLGRHGRFECWRRDALPERWAFGSHPRVPALLCQADTGWRFVSRERAARRPGGWMAGFNLGSHGYDPADPSMRAVFIAHGPGFVPALEIAPFDNVHVHPLLAALLGIEVPAGLDGERAVLAPILSAGRD